MSILTTVRGWKEDSVLESFYSDREWSEGIWLIWYCQGKKYAMATWGLKVCFWKQQENGESDLMRFHFEARDRRHRKCDKSFGMWWPPSVYIRNRMTFALKVIAQKKAKLKGNGQDVLSESGKTLKVCLDRNSKSCEGRTDILEWIHTKDERSRHIN